MTLVDFFLISMIVGLAVLALLYWFFGSLSCRLIYKPRQKFKRASASQLPTGTENITLLTGDHIRLRALMVPRSEDGPLSKHELSPIALFCHSGVGDIMQRTARMEAFRKLGVDSLFFDYRGYGGNKGRPTEEGLYRDATSALHHLVYKRGINPARIILYGQSLGAAVATHLAFRQPCAALILESAFPRLKDLVEVARPFYPTRFVSNSYNIIDPIHRIRCPKLMIHSMEDQQAPLLRCLALFKNVPPPKELLILRGRNDSCAEESLQNWSEGMGHFLNAHLVKENL
ncbi:MAG: alpha/beta hydrolase [Candidatus Omnitrophica bacterium]|nr:alpha/beta hydrolase [Candidatus Omnitrophota bacterium]